LVLKIVLPRMLETVEIQPFLFIMQGTRFYSHNCIHRFLWLV